MFTSQKSFLSLPHLSFFVKSAPSAWKPPRSCCTQLPPRGLQPNLFHLFPHAALFARTPKLANPFACTVYLTVLWITPGWGTRAAQSLRFHSTQLLASVRNSSTTPLNATLTRSLATTHSKALMPKLNPLDATLAKNQEGPSTHIPFFPKLVASLRHYFLAANSLNYSQSEYHNA